MSIVTIDMFLKGRAVADELPPDLRQNMAILLRRLNKVLPIYAEETGRPIKVNDGYRRLQDAARYGAARSKHLYCQAADIDDDDDATLWKWCLRNLRRIAEAGLWLEDARWTHGLQPNGQLWSWVHFQSVAPASGYRIFRPSMNPPTAPDLWDGDYPSELNYITTGADGAK